MDDLKLKEITEYIFSPFSTFIYLNRDEIRFQGIDNVRQKILDKLNEEPLVIKESNQKVIWCVEESEQFKLSKGVFAPPGKGNSFIMAKLICDDTSTEGYCITEDIKNYFKSEELSFNDINFYFHEFGIATCSANIVLKKKSGLIITELDEVSEWLNNLYKEYFQNISYQLAEQYINAINELDIPHYEFDFFPKIEDVDKDKFFIPWTHRLYRIEEKKLFELENPGLPFQFLLTPSKQMDVKDLSIYENRYIYFGWGHSLILESGEIDGYSQTNTPADEYVRLIEIAQANWQNLDILADLVDVTTASFHEFFGKLKPRELKKAIYEIREFSNAIDRILDYYKGVKITFDTEKRILLKELNGRWLTSEMYEKLQEKLIQIEELLEDLFNRQKERREEALNTIALLFTITSVIEIIALIIEIFNPNLTPWSIVLIIAAGTSVIAIAILFYIRLAGRE